MRKFALVLIVTGFMSISAFAQAKSGVEGVWKLTEIATTGVAGAAAAPSAAATSIAAAPDAASKQYAAVKKITQPSMYLFTKNHYSIIYVAADKPRPVMENYEKASQEELHSIFVKDFVANAGTYEVKTGKLTVRPMVAKSPGYMTEGSWSAYTMKLSGNTMTLVSESSNTGPSKNPVTYTLTRVE